MFKIIVQKPYNPKLFLISHETAVYSIDCLICSIHYDYWCIRSKHPPPLEPSVTAVRLSDNSILITWENIPTTHSYVVGAFEGDVRTLVVGTSTSSPYTLLASDSKFDRVNNADRIGVVAVNSADRQTGSYRYAPVPPLPTVTAERLADNSIKVSWENIRTHELFIVFNLFVINGDTEAPVNFIPPGDVRSFTFSPTHDNFNEINDADRVGVSGTIDGKSVDKTFADVPPEPTVTAVRLADDSIKVSWENIRNDFRFYQFFVTEDGTDSKLFRCSSCVNSFTFSTTHHLFDRVNDAQRIGVSGTIVGAINTFVDQRFVPVPAPTLPTVTAVRLADNSILITWSNIRTDAVSGYSIRIIEDGVSNRIQANILEETFTILTTHSHFDRINNAEEIGVDGTASTPKYIPVPAQRLPTVTAERLDNNSLKLDWENIRTTNNIYQIRVSDSTGNSLAFTIDVTGNSHTFSPSDTNFDQVNNADKIIIGGLINEQLVDHRSVKVPAQIPPLTIERRDDNSLKVSWKNIPSDTGRYDIWISGNGFDQRVERTSENPFIFTSNHADFDKINRANSIGIVASNGHLADRVYGDIPPLLPLGIPTLSSGDITDTTIELLWTKAVDAISYELFRDDTSIENTTARTFTDTGLTPEIEYTYHVRSVGDSDIVSDSSNVLTVTTLATLEITFERLAGGDIEVTWKGVGSTGGANSIWIIENDVKTEIISSTTSPHTFSTLDDLYERVSNAEEIGVSDLNASSDDVEFIKIKSKDGNSDEWKTKPTFGNSWDTQTQLVDAGFVFNGIALTITDNWHTDFDLTSSIIGENNVIHIKGYASNDFKSVTLSLGIPEIGKKYDAESHITLNLNRNYTTPSDYQIMEILHDQKEELVNESLTSATLSKAKCTPADVVKQCIDFEISFVMMAPLKYEVLAISAMDTRYRETVTFINQGVEFVGESLLESQTHVLTQKYSNQHPVETIELTQLDRRYQMWEDQNGYLWTQNEYGSWLQITMPDITQRDDPATSVMTRNHSNFAGMITQEQDRAVLVFNSSDIQGIADETFAHDTPLRLEKLSNPEVLEILHIQALLAEELLCDCILLED